MPDTVDELSSALTKLLTDKELAEKLGETGKKGCDRNFRLRRCPEVYPKCIEKRRRRLNGANA